MNFVKHRIKYLQRKSMFHPIFIHIVEITEYQFQKVIKSRIESKSVRTYKNREHLINKFKTSFFSELQRKQDIENVARWGKKTNGNYTRPFTNINYSSTLMSIVD